VPVRRSVVQDKHHQKNKKIIVEHEYVSPAPVIEERVIGKKLIITLRNLRGQKGNE